MARTKQMLLGGAAVSLALATIVTPGLPAWAQQAVDAAACADLEGDAHEACLDAEVIGDEPEPVLADDAPQADAEAGEEPEAVEDVKPGPAELGVEDAVDVPELLDATDAEAAADEPVAVEETEVETVEDEAVDALKAVSEPENEAVGESETEDTPTGAARDSEPALREETEVEPVADEPIDVPETTPEIEVEAVDESEAEETGTQTVEEAEPALREETEVEAVEDEAVDGPGTAAETEVEAVDESETEETETDAAQDTEPALRETEVEADDEGETEEIQTEAVEDSEPPLREDLEVETVEDEAIDPPEAADETDVQAVGEGETEEAEAEAVDAGDVLSDEELEVAQRESTEEAVQAALAAERQKSQTQQEAETDDRMRILGAAAAGLAVGAFLPEIGAMLVGQQGDRVILQQDERLIVRRDETARFLQEGSDVRVDELADGVSLVTVARPDGSRVLSWRDASGQVVRRVRMLPDGREIILFDGREVAGPEIRVTELPPIRREDQRRAFLSGASAEELVQVLSSRPVSAVEDRFTLRQILANDRIRWLMPSLSLDAVNFDSGSATLGIESIQALDTMGQTLREMVDTDPQEVFLVEGHTDAVGSDISNLALSDRRAETVATLLTTYYEVPPENLVVQGFGEQDLQVRTLAASRENRRVEVRRITPLLR